MAELAAGFRIKVKDESNYKRMQRFFQKFDLQLVADFLKSEPQY
jgi:hypothetical protein